LPEKSPRSSTGDSEPLLARLKAAQSVTLGFDAASESLTFEDVESRRRLRRKAMSNAGWGEARNHPLQPVPPPRPPQPPKEPRDDEGFRFFVIVMVAIVIFVVVVAAMS
jgi:hypothetical protein